MSCRPKLGNFEALVFSYEFLLTTARTYVIMYVGSIRVMHTIVSPLLNHIPFWHGSSLSLYAHTSGSHFCHYVQMDHPESASADVEAWTLVN
jgi:hypothetical protein